MCSRACSLYVCFLLFYSCTRIHITYLILNTSVLDTRWFVCDLLDNEELKKFGSCHCVPYLHNLCRASLIAPRKSWHINVKHRDNANAHNGYLTNLLKGEFYYLLL